MCGSRGHGRDIRDSEPVEAFDLALRRTAGVIRSARDTEPVVAKIERECRAVLADELARGAPIGCPDIGGHTV